MCHPNTQILVAFDSINEDFNENLFNFKFSLHFLEHWALRTVPI